MRLGFRRMSPEDAAEVESIEKACFRTPWSREAFWQEAASEDAYYLLALDGEKIIGYVGAWVVQGEAQITNVAIAPPYRRRGAGRQMMEEIIRIVKEKGCKAITLEVRPSNAPALALYKSLGFYSVGRRPRYYLDDGEDAEILWKTGL